MSISGENKSKDGEGSLSERRGVMEGMDREERGERGESVVGSGASLRAKRLARIDELLQLLGGATTAGIQSEISLRGAIEEGSVNLAEREEFLEELGALLYAEDRIKEAQDTLYALLKINPQNATALGYIELIRSRLDFVNKDLMNP